MGRTSWWMGGSVVFRWRKDKGLDKVEVHGRWWGCGQRGCLRLYTKRFGHIAIYLRDLSILVIFTFDP